MSNREMKEKCGPGKLRIDSAVLESDPKLKSKKECSGRKRIIRKFVWRTAFFRCNDRKFLL